MKNTLITSLGCLFIALALNVAFTYSQTANSNSMFSNDIPWLKLYATKDPTDDNIRPSSTVIYTSFQPYITETAPHLWKITFYEINP